MLLAPSSAGATQERRAPLAHLAARDAVLPNSTGTRARVAVRLSASLYPPSSPKPRCPSFHVPPRRRRPGLMLD